MRFARPGGGPIYVSVVTHRLFPRLAPASLLTAATLAVAPGLGAQGARTTVAVTARIAPLRSAISLLPAARASAGAVTGSSASAPPLAPGALTVRAAASYQVRVWRRIAGGLSTFAASHVTGTVVQGDSSAASLPTSDAARVWVRDERGRLRPLAAGSAVGLGGGQAGERRVPGLDCQVDSASAGRVALVYEIRVAGEAQ